MPDQRDIADLGGTMRLGSYPCCLIPGTVAAQAYGANQVTERHRHRFEFNNEYRESLGRAGLALSGLSPDGRLVEIAEIKNHFADSSFTEFKSQPAPTRSLRPSSKQSLAAGLAGDPATTGGRVVGRGSQVRWRNTRVRLCLAWLPTA
jgi:CTP synthase (UTP-ammonia lyase)